MTACPDLRVIHRKRWFKLNVTEPFRRDGIIDTIREAPTAREQREKERHPQLGSRGRKRSREGNRCGRQVVRKTDQLC